MTRIRFDGQVAIVTGAGNGLGRAYALELAARGASVVVNDLGTGMHGTIATRERADRVVDEIAASGGAAAASYESVATARGGAAIVQTALDRFGRVDILINNAGQQRNALFEDLSEAMIDQVLDSHLKGAFFVSQPAYRLMKAQRYGRILFTSSGTAAFGRMHRANYAAAKGGVIGLMNVVAIEGAPHGIVANCILPNASIERPEGRPAHVSGEPEADEPTRAAMAALRPAMGVEFVAPLAAYLVSRECATSRGLYSAAGGRFARGFIGMPAGWLAPFSAAPSVEDVAAHIAEIDDVSGFTCPASGRDEFVPIAARIRERT